MEDLPIFLRLKSQLRSGLRELSRTFPLISFVALSSAAFVTAFFLINNTRSAYKVKAGASGGRPANIMAGNFTPERASISFVSDSPSQASIRYGFTESDLKFEASDTRESLVHQVNLVVNKEAGAAGDSKKIYFVVCTNSVCDKSNPLDLYGAIDPQGSWSDENIASQGGPFSFEIPTLEALPESPMPFYGEFASPLSQDTLLNIAVTQSNVITIVLPKGSARWAVDLSNLRMPFKGIAATRLFVEDGKSSIFYGEYDLGSLPIKLENPRDLLLADSFSPVKASDVGISTVPFSWESSQESLSCQVGVFHQEVGQIGLSEVTPCSLKDQPILIKDLSLDEGLKDYFWSVRFSNPLTGAYSGWTVETPFVYQRRVSLETADGEKFSSGKAHLSWRPLFGATSYEVEVGLASSEEPPVKPSPEPPVSSPSGVSSAPSPSKKVLGSFSTSDPFYDFEGATGYYFWKVRPLLSDCNCNGDWSQTRFFTLGSISKP